MITAKKFQHTYNYGFIDETTKKEIRRKLLKAVALRSTPDATYLNPMS